MLNNGTQSFIPVRAVGTQGRGIMRWGGGDLDHACIAELLTVNEDKILEELR